MLSPVQRFPIGRKFLYLFFVYLQLHGWFDVFCILHKFVSDLTIELPFVA